MESLLNLAFTNLASRDTARIRKGLRQVEGLLAQICLACTPPPPSPRSQIYSQQSQQAPQAALAVLADDAAFLEFFRLQSGFEWNVATRLIETLEKLLGLRSTSLTDSLVFASLTTLHGILLLHPPSRSLFAREIHLTLLLDLLDPAGAPSVAAAALAVLAVAMLGNPSVARLFEGCQGVDCVLLLLKAEMQDGTVGAGVREVLMCYLLPETAAGADQGSWGSEAGGVPLPATISRSDTQTSNGSTVMETTTRSVSSKRALLAARLAGLDLAGFVAEDLQTSASAWSGSEVTVMAR